MAKEMRFPVTIDDSQAAKELNKLESKIGKLKDSIAKAESSRTPIVEQLKEAQDAAVKAYARVEELKAALAESEYKTSPEGLTDPDTFYAELQRQSEIKAELAEQEKIMQAKEQEAQKLEAADAKILEKLALQNAELEEAQTRAGELTKQITDASKGADIKAAMEGAKSAIQGGVKSILKYGIGIRTLYVLFRKLKQYTIEAVKAFAENDPETKKNIDDLKASLSALKGSWGAAFAPVLNAVVPVLQTLIGWLTKAMNAVAAFFAIISGKGSFKKAVANTEKLSDNLASGAGAAKDLKKQLMGIDTLNVMSDNSDTGGGGGGSNNPYEWVEEEVDTSSFMGKLALSIKDVLFDWSDLTPEQIAEKCFAAIPTMIGVVAGGMVGGLPGALIGGLVGLTLGILADSIIFDHDRELSESEIMSMVVSALLMMGFAAIGLSLGGGPLGAAIGAAVGLGLSLLVKDIGIETKSNWSESTLLEKFAIVLGGLAGGVIGFSVGGPAGAALGAAMGILLTMTINNLDLDNKWIPQVKKWLWDDGILKILEEVKHLTVEPATNLINGIVEKFQGLKTKLSGIVDNIKNLFNFQFRLPQLKLPHLQVQWQDAGALAQFFGITKLPHLSVSWYARGGIVDGATLIGAGEAGKEAIVPLERNTQWVTMVANELADIMIDRMTDKFAGLNMRMPAVAGGFVAPPNAFSSGGGYGISPELESKIDALLDRLNGNNRPIEVRTTVELDKRKVGEAVYTYTEERNRGRGK